MKKNRQRQLLLSIVLACTTVTFAQVGIGTTAPNASSMLDVDVSALSSTEKKGLLPPRMTQVQRNAIASPAEGLTIFNTDSKCLEFFDGTNWLCHLDLPKDGSVARKGALSCKSLKDNYPASVDGTYWLDIDGTGPIASMQAYCDMTTDGGGWTLIGQYNTSNSGRTILNRTDFPNLGSNTIGNESASTGSFGYWGVSNASIRATLPFTSYRVEAKSSRAASSTHWKSTDVNWLKTGASQSQTMANYTILSPTALVTTVFDWKTAGYGIMATQFETGNEHLFYHDTCQPNGCLGGSLNFYSFRVNASWSSIGQQLNANFATNASGIIRLWVK